MTDYTCDILILEDDAISRSHIDRQMPDWATCEYADSVDEFRRFLDEGGRARLYLMDDRIPHLPGGEKSYDPAEAHFIDNCEALYARQPDAKVLYTGTMPGSEEKKFCEEHNIQMPGKRDIFELGDLVERELADSTF